MCMCVSHKSPTAQKLVSCTEISCLDSQGRLHEPVPLTSAALTPYEQYMVSQAISSFTSRRRILSPPSCASLTQTIASPASE